MQARVLSAALCLAMFCPALGGVGTAHAQSPSSYDFAYRILGDRLAAPIQVFDDGRRTYMQFRAGQATPAIFSTGAQGERLVPVAWQGGYAVVQGTEKVFALRLGDSVAQAQYQGAVPRLGVAEVDEIERPAMPVAAKATPVVVKALPPALAFEATPGDRTMRQALKRWAGMAGWTFEAEHWAVDVDIPLAGAASLGGEFKPAVRELLASTELSAHPLQPCFYANKVLRVIPLAESCSRGMTVLARQG